LEEYMETPPLAPAPEEPRKSNTPLIIGAIVAVLLCCCCVIVLGGWFYGDQIIEALGM
jgi:hypothetical protein